MEGAALASQPRIDYVTPDNLTKCQKKNKKKLIEYFRGKEIS